MNATTMLQWQHGQVEQLFRQYERADGVSQKRKLFAAISARVARQLHIEERILFPEVHSDGIEAPPQAAVDEHLATSRLLAELLTLPVGDPQFERTLKVLHDELLHRRELEVQLVAMRRAA
ncbi:MAG: hemerythrin domain-containing protein [Archangiaceae bacterium]|nr:hemerythrin domain-containing protein [Archangiaceae bacterium]